MMADEGSKNFRNNFGKFIYQFCTYIHTYIYIYIYIYIERERERERGEEGGKSNIKGV